MIQGNRADRQAGAIVGLHYHLHQADYWYVPVRHAPRRAARPARGLARPTAPRSRSTSAAADGTHDHRGVFIPPGVAHGFAALTDMTITYLVDGYYNPADELGVAWDDPAIGADWGVTEPDRCRSATRATRARRPAGRPCARTGRCGPEPMKLLVTGGAGFIGSNYVRHVLANTDDEVTVYDALTYAGNLVDAPRRRRRPALPVREGQHLRPRTTLEDAMDGHDAVVHFAAESHVDRSIVGPDDFVNTNCFGTNVVMDTARRLEIERVVHIGTDEVYGSVEVGSSTETDPLEPRSPYSASKAGLRPDRALVPPHLRAAGHRHALHEQLRAVPVPREGRSRCSPPTCSTARRSRSTATASTSATGSTSTTTARASHLVLRQGRPSARSTTSAPATRRRTACSSTSCSRCSARTRRSVEYVDRPPRPRPPLLGRHRQDHRARLAQAAHARRGARRRPSPGTATTAGGGSRSSSGAR